MATVKIIIGTEEKTFSVAEALSLDQITKIKVKKTDDAESEEWKLSEIVVSYLQLYLSRLSHCHSFACSC